MGILEKYWNLKLRNPLGYLNYWDKAIIFTTSIFVGIIWIEIVQFSIKTIPSHEWTNIYRQIYLYKWNRTWDVMIINNSFRNYLIKSSKVNNLDKIYLSTSSSKLINENILMEMCPLHFTQKWWYFDVNGTTTFFQCSQNITNFILKWRTWS